jgi:signal peptidase I
MRSIKLSEPKDAESSHSTVTKRQYILKEARSFLLIFFIVFAFRSSFFEPFKIPSGSMIPTLMIGDFILVDKMSYGLKLPFTEWLSSPVYINSIKSPLRGDVIVFKYPKDEKRDYIKRVIGLPGDEVEVRSNVIYVNGEPVKFIEVPGKKFLEDMDEQFKKYKLKFFKIEEGKKEYFIQHNEDEYHQQNFKKIVVPENNFFVMGDNRDFSNDSRIWGTVPRENIKGKAIFVWFSMIFPFGQHPFKFRPWRIGTLIE